MVWTSDVPSSDQLRDLKKTELLKAAARYFSRHGYHGASLTEIAKALGLTKSAIYYYYSDKQSLLFECSKWAHEAILLLDEGTDTDPLVRLRTLCVAYVELVVEHELGFMMFSDLENLSESECRSIIALRDRFEQRIRSLLGEARESGKLGASDPKMAALMILGSLNWMQKWFDPGGPMSATQIADQFVRVTIAGLGAVEAEDQNRSMRELKEKRSKQAKPK